MADIVLNSVTSSSNVSTMNDNFNKIELSINNDVVKNKGGKNTLNQDLDVNNNRLLNVLYDPSNLTGVVVQSVFLKEVSDRLFADSGIQSQIVTMSETISNLSDPYELALFSPSSVNALVYWEVTNIATGAVATGLFNGTPGLQIPSASTLLCYMWAYRTNNATALAVGLDVMSDYIETDQ